MKAELLRRNLKIILSLRATHLILKTSLSALATVCSGRTIFLSYLKELEKTKPVVLCGDLNVAHNEIDLKNPKTNRKNAGFTDEERGKMTALLDSGFIDTYRCFYPDKEGVLFMVVIQIQSKGKECRLAY